MFDGIHATVALISSLMYSEGNLNDEKLTLYFRFLSEIYIVFKILFGHQINKS